VSIARYVGGMQLQTASGDGQDVGLPAAAQAREGRP
jgi:multicomponent Na+:H+ antiporter subunit F